MFHQLLPTSAEGKEIQRSPVSATGKVHFKGRRPGAPARERLPPSPGSY